MKRKILLFCLVGSMCFNVACSNSNDEIAKVEATTTTSIETTTETTTTQALTEVTTSQEVTETTTTETGTTETDTTTSTSDSSQTQNTDELLQFSDMQQGEQIVIMNTSMGDIKIRFFENQAPKAVENFITHAQNGYYDGLTFHRVMDEFMIQGGDPLGTGTGGESIWGTPFEDEVTPELRNFHGALSMANSGTNTNGSQFFIVQNQGLTQDFKDELQYFIDNQDVEINGITISDVYPTSICEKYIEIGGTPWLDGAHTVFGQVYEGMDIVTQIAQVETDANNMPLEDVIIISIDVTTY